jgi:adenosylcobinamide kinase / adenosylcobinamide-phosphate guanylyltransferase
MSGRLVLITGAVRSGKSRFAERLAGDLAAKRDGDAGVTYVATARVWDDEMEARVRAHRETRPAGWHTVEEPERLAEAIEEARRGGAGVVLVESLDMWVSNRLMATHSVEGDDQSALDGAKVRDLESELLAEVDRLVEGHQAMTGGDAHLIVVTVEAGWGVVPPYPLGRAFRDLLGRVNSALAAEADEVNLMVAGLPVEVKRLSAAAVASDGASMGA